MDSKALAKSKRAHSLHHARKPRAPPPAGPRHARERALPSNWDRYDDEEANAAAPVPVDDAVLPKSKGADYRHLIEEARSSQGLRRPLASLDDELLLSVGDIFPVEFNERMLRVKGESIATWIEDDNFVVEDGVSSSGYEASIFSLNLHALSEQLAKVDISKRLFIEADLVATDMEADRGAVDEYEKKETPSLVEEKDKLDHSTGIFLSGSSPNCSKDFKSADQGLSTISQARDDLIPSQHCTNSQSKPSTSKVKAEQGSEMPDLGFSSLNNRNNMFNRESKPSHLEVSASEAELDRLLDSFNEAALHGCSEKEFINRTSEVGYAANGSSRQVLADNFSDVGSQARADLNSSEDIKAFSSSAIDFLEPRSTSSDAIPKYPSTFETAVAEEELDMLLNSAGNSKSQGPSFDSVPDILKESPKPIAQFTGEVPGRSQAVTVAGSLEDVLDDILEETSNMVNQDSLYRPEKVKSANGEQPPSSQTLSNSKVLDDFDSWMDTL